MGEMAEFYIHQHMDAFPDDFWANKRHTRPTCKYCGMRGLKWKETDRGWRLSDSNTGELHTCKEYFQSKLK
jgi:hypothetical protein